jgi:cob(I)alamin adenosyltransferase
MSAARVLIFTGDGKGKTTAALGLALRAAGHGMRVAIVQFIKADRNAGELRAIAGLPGVTLEQFGRGFLPKPEDPAWAEHRAAATEGLRRAREIVAGRAAALIILDEVCLAVARGLLGAADVLAVVAEAAPETCLVLTGRGASQALLDAADTVTEMRPLKHGFQIGIPAQVGVEW